MTHRELRQMRINKGTDKLIVTCQPDYREELYDLNSDPSECGDRLSGSPLLASELRADLKFTAFGDQCLAIAKAVAGQNPDAGLNSEQIRQLRSLGYIQ